MKWLAFALAILPQTASALSCLRPDVARSFTQAAEAEAVYSVVLGTFRGGADVEPPATLTVQFDGRALSDTGFDLPFAAPVSVEITCLSAWCGYAPADDVTTLAFLRWDGEGGYVLSESACPQWSFGDPNHADVARVVACMQGQSCEETP